MFYIVAGQSNPEICRIVCFSRTDPDNPQRTLLPEKLNFSDNTDNFSNIVIRFIRDVFGPAFSVYNTTLITERKVLPAPVRMMADAEKMERIYFNLFSNAVKYTPENGKIAIRLSMTEQN